MAIRRRNASIAVIALAWLAAGSDAGAQAAAGGTAAAGSNGASNGTVFDVTGTILVRRGARTFNLARGNLLQPGDQIFVFEGAAMTISCPGQNAVRIVAGNTFTYSGCQPAPLVAQTEPEAAPEAASTSPAAAAPPPPAAPAPPARSGRGGGATLGIIGGIGVLGAAAGGGGGGGGSNSSSPPASP